MRFLRHVAGVAALAVVTSTAGAQQVTLNFDDLSCSSTPLTTYQSWISLFSGVTCAGSSQSWAGASSNPNYILQSNGQIGWSFLNGPVTLDGMWVSGFGTYYLELLNGGSVVHSNYFSLLGSPTHVLSGYSSDVDAVRISIRSGYSTIGVDDIKFTSLNPPPGGGTGANGGDLLNDPSVTPEPATLLLVATGLGGIGAFARRRRKQAPKA